MAPAAKIIGHAFLAAAFFYCVQRFVLGEGPDVAVIWSIAGGCAAALLAWVQYRRAG